MQAGLESCDKFFVLFWAKITEKAKHYLKNIHKRDKKI